jgi:hypothetical protein
MHTYQISIDVADVIVYILGCFVCFIPFRGIGKGINEGELRYFDYVIIIALSLWSWAAFIVFLIFSVLIHTKIFNPDKRTRW